MNQVTTGDFAPPPVRRFLARLLSHSSLDQQDQQAILKLAGQVAQISAGADIVRPDTNVVHLQLVARGVVERFDEAKDGKRTATAFFVPGEMCGLPGIESSTTTWGLSALTACSVIHVPKDQLRKLVDRYPAIRRAFWREMAFHASIQAKWAGNVILRDSTSRTAYLLCELAQRMEDAGAANRAEFLLKTSQSQLAQAMGLTGVHMNRVLRELRDKGLVATQTLTITVRDWQGLRELAGFDPAYLHRPHDEPSSA